MDEQEKIAQLERVILRPSRLKDELTDEVAKAGIEFLGEIQRAKGMEYAFFVIFEATLYCDLLPRDYKPGNVTRILYRCGIEELEEFLRENEAARI